MRIEKEYSYSRPTLVKRICPACGYTHSEFEGTQKFIPLESVYAYDRGTTVKLYACPKCGTVGIDIDA